MRDTPPSLQYLSHSIGGQVTFIQLAQLFTSNICDQTFVAITIIQILHQSGDYQHTNEIPRILTVPHFKQDSCRLKNCKVPSAPSTTSIIITQAVWGEQILRNRLLTLIIAPNNAQIQLSSLKPLSGSSTSLGHHRTVRIGTQVISN